MRIHPVAALFPMLPDSELAELADDIRLNGLIHKPVTLDGVLLDGRNRLAACRLVGVEPEFSEYSGDSPVAFIVACNLHRRHLTIGQKVALGVELESHFAVEAKRRQREHGGTAPGKKSLVGKSPTSDSRARDHAAKAVGVSGKTLSAAKAIKVASPKLFEQVKAGEITVARARREAKAEADQKALSHAQATISDSRRKSLASVCDLRVCSCAELFKSGIKPDAVITDPPYPHEFLPVFSELAESAIGVPLVAVMSGQSYLPEVFARLCKHLKYRWTLAYLTPGGQAVQQWAAKINAAWKPVLLFGEPSVWIGDVTRSDTNDNDKRFHGWGQSESGIADLIERLTQPGQLVCDPFLGGGTTAAVSLALGRRFVGCDIDSKAVETARSRIEAANA